MDWHNQGYQIVQFRQDHATFKATIFVPYSQAQNNIEMSKERTEQ
jgi:hypothetical protein